MINWDGVKWWLGLIAVFLIGIPVIMLMLKYFKWWAELFGVL